MGDNEASRAAPEEVIPLMDWESKDITSATVLWWEKLAERYQIEVQCNVEAEYTSWLCIFDRCNDDTLIYSEKVDHPYGTERTPSVDDIFVWRQIAETITGERFLLSAEDSDF